MSADLLKEHAFQIWAFGEETFAYFLLGKKDLLDLLEGWNKLHGDVLLIDPEEIVDVSLEKMQQLWRKEDGKEALQSLTPSSEIDSPICRTKKASTPLPQDNDDSYMGTNENSNKVKKGRKVHGQKNAQSHPQDEASRKGSCKGKDEASSKGSKGCGKEKRKACKDR